MVFVVIAGLILAALLGTGGLIWLLRQPGLDAISTGIIEQVMAPVTQSITQLFIILAYLTPLLIAVVPVYFVMSSKANLKDRSGYMVFGAIFGLGLYGVAYLTGIDQLLIQEIRGSWFVGSTLDMSLISGAADYVLGAVTSLALWGAGILLQLIGVVLDGLVGIGEAAKGGSKRVKKTQKGILERLLGGS